MPDIVQQDAPLAVERRLDGRSQGGGKDARGQASSGQVPKKVVENYQEVAKTKPFDDRITILGIPVEQITPSTQAALAGLVAEINHLRNVVKRHEQAAEKRSGKQPAQNQQTTTDILEPEAFERVLGATLGQPAGEGMTWITVLVHVATYEDIRRSSGLLAANGALADVAHRLKDMRLNTTPDAILPVASPGPTAAPSVPFVLLGYVGGSNLAAVTVLPLDGLDTAAVARAVYQQLTSGGYSVGGIDMALAISTAATAVGTGESPLLALGRVDHLLRS
jgi:hypothetical protein